MHKENKELVLFYVLLATVGAISGTSIGSRLGSVILSSQVAGALLCGSLVVPTVFVAGNLILGGKPKKVHEEMLSKFGDGYCGVILFFLSFWVTSTAIRVGLGAAANAILPGAVMSGALTLGIIGAIVPIISFLTTHCIIMPIVEKVNHYIIEPIVEKVRERIYSKKVELDKID